MYTIPAGVTTICDEAFAGCGSLTNVVLPDSLTTIGDKAFYQCIHLKDVTIPNHVTTIGNGAFASCGLESITIPAGMTTIEEGIIRCKRLRSIDVSPDHPSYQSIDGVLYSKDGKTVCCYPAAREGDAYTLPEGVTTMSDNVFANCANLKTLTLSESLTTIGDEAFMSCDHLVSLRLPESVTTIGSNLREQYHSLTIWAPRDSVAEKYAKEHKMRFESRSQLTL